MAGESAQDAARRMREKAARINDAAAKWERGAAGERQTALALDALPENEWTSFHDVRWPGRDRANIDHVVVGPSGIFVIDSKNWTGLVEVKDGVLRQKGWRREREARAVADAAVAIGRISALVGAEHVHPVLCLAREEPVRDAAHGVTLCSTSSLASILLGFPTVFVEQVRAEVASNLADWFAVAGQAPGLPMARPRPGGPVVQQEPVVAAYRGLPIHPADPPAKAKRGAVSSLVGIALAVSLLGVTFTHPGIFRDFGEAFVGMVGSHHQQSEQPAEKPAKHHSKKKAAKSRSTN